MSSRTHNYNAYTADVTSGLAPGIMTMTVDSVPPTLIGPIYFVIDADDPTKREWLKVGTINGLTMTILERGLTGSVGDDHDVGAKLESVTTMQILSDLFDDIESDEANLAAHESDPNDPHQPAGYMKQGDADDLYVAKTGSTMVGPLILSGDPTAGRGAATKDYVDDAPYVEVDGDTMLGDLILSRATNPSDDDLIAATKGYVDASLSGGAIFPSGTRMVFDQDSPPTGWTRDTTVSDRVIMVVSGARSDGGTWTQPDHQHTNPNTNTEANHQHVSAQHTHPVNNHSHVLASHDHTNPTTGQVSGGGTATAQENGGSNFAYAIGSHTHAQGNTNSHTGNAIADGPIATQNSASSSTGADGGHDHTVGSSGGSATADTWRPLNRQMIIAVKN